MCVCVLEIHIIHFGHLPMMIVPHITVWGSCFSLESRRGSLLRLLRHLLFIFTHHSLTTHSLTHSCTHALTHSRTHSLTQTLCLRVASWLPFFRRSTQSLLEELRLPFVWQAQFTEPPRGGVARVGAAGPRLPFVWQAQYEPPGRAAARVAAAGPRLPFVWQAQYTEPSWTSRGARGRRWAAAAGCLSCGRRSTQSLQEELGRAWPPLGSGCLLCGRRTTQSLQEELASWTSCGARGRRWAAATFRVAGAVRRASTSSLTHYLSHTNLSHTIFQTPSLTHQLWHTIFHTTLSHTIFHTQLCHTPSCTNHFVTHYLSHTALSHTIFHIFSHHLSHTIFHTPSTPSFTHNFATHHLSHTTLSHTIFHTTLSHTIFHTPSVTHHLCQHFVTHHQHHLSHTIFDTPSFTHNFVTHYFSHTIFHTHLCHTPSLTHHLSHTALSHTIFHHTIFVTHHLSRRQLCHTPSFLHLFPCLSFLPRPRNNISCSLLEEVDLWGYPVLLFVISRYFPFLCPLSPASYIQKLSSASWFTPVGKRLIIPIKSRVGRVGPVLTRVMVLPTGLNQE